MTFWATRSQRSLGQQNLCSVVEPGHSLGFANSSLLPILPSTLIGLRVDQPTHVSLPLWSAGRSHRGEKSFRFYSSLQQGIGADISVRSPALHPAWCLDPSSSGEARGRRPLSRAMSALCTAPSGLFVAAARLPAYPLARLSAARKHETAPRRAHSTDEGPCPSSKHE